MGFWDGYNQLQTKNATMQQPQEQGGIAGFLGGIGRGLVKSVSNDVSNIGNNIASSASFFGRQLSGEDKRRQQEILDLQKKSAQAKIQAVNAPSQFVAAPGTKNRQQLERTSTGAENVANILKEQQKSNTADVNKNVDPAKFAASVADLGLTFAGGGAGANVLKGGLRQAITRSAKQGALFGGLQGGLEPIRENGIIPTTLEDVGGNALAGAGTGALMGGAFGGVAKGGEKLLSNRGKIASIITGEPAKEKGTGVLGTFGSKRMAQKLEKIGNDLLGSQANLTRPETRKLGTNPAKVLGSINQRTGLTNIDDMADFARELTGAGDKSILDTVTRAAVGEAKGVNIGDIRKLAQNALDDGGSVITPSERKQLLGNMTQAGVTMRGGAKGSISDMANAGKALDQANVFRTTANDLLKGATVTASQRQQAKIYNKVASQLEDAIYKAPGVGDSLPSLKRAASDDLLHRADEAETAGNTAKSNAYRSIANEVDNIKDVAELRSMKKDFVNLSKIDRATADAKTGAASQIAGNVAGLGRFIQRPTNLLAIPLNSATPKVGGFLAGKGRGILQRADQDAAQRAAAEVQKPSSILPAAQETAGTVAIPAIAANASQSQNQPVDTTQQDGTNQLPAWTGEGYDPNSIGSSTTSGSPFDAENIDSTIQTLLDQGASQKDIAAYLANAKAINDIKSAANPASKSLSAASADAIENANSALSSIQTIRDQLSKDPSVQGKSGVSSTFNPFGITGNVLGTGQYDNAIANAKDVIGRLRTGAAITGSEEQTYTKMLPQAGDSPELVEQKLSLLENAFNGIVNKVSGNN